MKEKSCGNCLNCFKGDKFWSCEEYGFYHNGTAPVKCSPPDDDACDLWTDDPKKANSWMEFV